MNQDKNRNTNEERHSEHWFTYVAVLILVVLIGGIFLNHFWEEQSLLEHPAPELDITQWVTPNPPDSNTIENSTKVVEFWATWCAPCIESMPKMERLAARYQPKGVVFIGISLDESPMEVKNFADSRSMNYNLAMNTGQARRFKVDTIPDVFIIDPNNNIRWRGRPFDAEFEEKIQQALQSTQ